MKKGQSYNKMLARFPIITDFIAKKGRFPTNFEVATLFKISSGMTTHLVLTKYRKSLTHCTVCGHKK